MRATSAQPAFPPLLPSDNLPTATWPKVPPCYGWLGLTRRGEWRLGDGVVRHGGLIDFISRGYGPAGDGSWCVSNGPQRVFVTLDYTPWVWRFRQNELQAHTGQPAGDMDAAWLDEEGNLLIATRTGIGVLDDRDLPEMLQCMRDGRGIPLPDSEIEALCSGNPSETSPFLALGKSAVPLGRIRKAEVPQCFHFNPAPQEPASTTA